MTVQERKDRDCVRELARGIAEIAAGEENERIRRRWRDVNALRPPDRAPVWCRPVGAWGEILPEETLRCEDPWLRGIERGFRQTLVKREIDDDTPVEGHFSVGAVFDVDPPNTWGVDIGRHQPSQAGGAWKYDPPIKTEEDMDRLCVPAFSCNEARTQESLARTEDLLGDILPVKLVCGPRISGTICTYAASLRGLAEMMMDMIAAPELMHRLMGYLRDGMLASMAAAEQTGLLTPNNTGPMTCSDPIGPETGNGVTYKNLWCMANSQEFDQVSPAMWEEFLLDYQRPIFDRFGMVGYGCCENLTHKIDGVLSIPNLRIFVSSAWTDLGEVIDRVGTDYVIMWRQKASAVVFPDDIDVVRRELEEGLKQLKGCHVQVVLRELQTLAGHPDRLHAWAEVGKEMAAKYA